MSAWPTTTALASGCFWRARATSSRQALASLSTRVGRALSLLKPSEQSALTCGTGGGGGNRMVTEVLAVAVCVLSSVTLQVIPTGPVGAPTELNSAMVPLPPMVPAAAEYI